MALFRSHPHNIDLKLFAVVRMSEAWDGRSVCYDGDTWELLIYKSKVVAESRAKRVNGTVELRTSTGNDFWWPMYNQSLAYMKILHICRHKYFTAHGTQPPENLDTSRGDWDVVEVAPQTFSALQEHPQYLEMARNFKLSLVTASSGYRVEITALAA
jgi:hypothetical protein